MKKYQVSCRQLNLLIAEPKKQAIFFGNAIETPGMIGRVFRQVTYFLHPMPAPRAGVEVRHHAEGPARDCLDASLRPSAVLHRVLLLRKMPRGRCRSCARKLDRRPEPRPTSCPHSSAPSVSLGYKQLP